MDTPFASQEPIVRWWAVTSSLLLGILVVLTGGSILLAERLEADSGISFYRDPTMRGIGLGTVTATWLVYMAALVCLLGYRDTANRRLLVLLVFLVCAALLCAVLMSIGFPFVFRGTRMVM